MERIACLWRDGVACLEAGRTCLGVGSGQLGEGGGGEVVALGHGAEVSDPDIVVAIYGRAPRTVDAAAAKLAEQFAFGAEQIDRVVAARGGPSVALRVERDALERVSQIHFERLVQLVVHDAVFTETACASLIDTATVSDP